MDDVALALELAEIAAAVALPLFERGVEPHKKSDGSVVTDGDFAVERALIGRLAAERPGDALLSEESGAIGQARRRWILDPIDGTSSFVAGRDTWGTHLALEIDGVITLGVITRPVDGECYWAARGGGAHRGAIGSPRSLERLTLSRTSELASSRVMVWAWSGDPRYATFETRCVSVEPGMNGMIDLLRGRIDGLLDCIGRVWDFAPGIVLVEEAGGLYTDLAGGRSLEMTGGCFAREPLQRQILHLARG